MGRSSRLENQFIAMPVSDVSCRMVGNTMCSIIVLAE